jgi:ComF family protein
MEHSRLPFKVRRLLNGTLSLVYPVRCFSCGSPCEASASLCAVCCSTIERPFSSEVINSIREVFPESQLADASALWVFEKQGALQRIHRAIKYGNQPYYGHALGCLLGNQVSRSTMSIDIVVPIPLHRARFNERGYNQCGPIADAVASALGTGCAHDLLLRTRGTRTQTRLSATARAANLEGAFEATHAAIGKSILLVDDVITSGATASAAAAALKQAGAIAVAACAVGFARR